MNLSSSLRQSLSKTRKGKQWRLQESVKRENEKTSVPQGHGTG